MNIDKRKITFETDLDISLLNQTPRGKNIVKSIKHGLNEGDIWLIKTWGIKFSLKKLVEFLYENGLDVFFIEYGSVTKLYICLIDNYKIDNTVVFSLKNVNSLYTNTK